MGLTGVLLEVSRKTCGHCRKEYGKHSKKNFMKCLYTANLNLYKSIMEVQRLKAETVNEPQTIEEKNGKVEIDTPEGKREIDVPKGAKVEITQSKKPEFQLPEGVKPAPKRTVSEDGSVWEEGKKETKNGKEGQWHNLVGTKKSVKKTDWRCSKEW